MADSMASNEPRVAQYSTRYHSHSHSPLFVFFHHPGPTKAPKKSSAFNVFVGWTSRTSPLNIGQNPKGSSNDLVLSHEVSPPTQIPDFILHDHHISETLTDIFSASCKLGLVPCLSVAYSCLQLYCLDPSSGRQFLAAFLFVKQIL